jgi:EAL domain-containing protein (putative c-di-GMP-specific phosphodiesterase class I)
MFGIEYLSHKPYIAKASFPLLCLKSDTPAPAQGKHMWTHRKAFAAEHPARSTSMQPLESAFDRTVLSRADLTSELLDRPVAQDSPRSLRRLLLASRLRRAIANRTLALHYQPQFDLVSGLASGMEVLARWFPLGGEAIEPSVFIPLAEETSQIEALGNWVIEAACEQAINCCSAGDAALTLCVNISPLQLNPQLVSAIRAILQRTGFPATRLELEITEGVLLSDCIATEHCLLEIKSMGIQIAIDDFGVGYSNLSYLSKFPIDRLKLDKSLIQQLRSDHKDMAILASIIDLCAALHIKVIAEGVESEYQFGTLERLGCDQVQGYLLGRPTQLGQAQLTMDKRWGERTPSGLQ